MDERARIAAAIAALEAQRALLGDEVVDLASGALRERFASGAAAEAQRRTVTVLFADVSGFTALSESMDAEDVAELLNALWVRLDGVLREHGGTIDKHLGDAVMALFGAPVAQEDDALRAVFAALALHAEVARLSESTTAADLRLRIGINTGPVLIGRVGTSAEVTAIGDAVNLAARLQATAPVGGIAVSARTWQLVARHFDGEPLGHVLLKGKAAPVEVWRVRGARARTQPGARLTPLVGRESEIEALLGALSEATEAPQLRLRVVRGEAGLGKSRLLDELAARAPGGLTVLRAGAMARRGPLLLVRDLVAESEGRGLEFLGPLLGPEPDALPRAEPVDNAELMGALGHWLGSLGPTLVLLDDVDRADSASLELFAALDGAPLPVLVVGTERPTPQPPWPGAPRVLLAPLGAVDTAALAERLLGTDAPPDLRELVAAQSDGNPFYIEELARMLVERRLHPEAASLDIPATLNAVLQARLDALSPETRAVLSACALVGPRLWDQAVSAVLGQVDLAEALGQLIERRILVEVPDPAFSGTRELRFRHALLHEVAYGRVLKRARSSGHGRAADWLAGRTGERVDEHAAAIAEHLGRAGRGAEAGPWLQRAGQHALRLGDFRAAIQAFERALALAADPPHQASLDLRLGQAYNGLGEFGAAGRHFDRVIAQPAAAPETRLEALRLRARLSFDIGDYERAQEGLEAALAMASAVGDDSTVPWVLRQRAYVALAQGRPERSLAHSNAAIVLASIRGDRAELALSHNVHGEALRLLGRYGEAVGAYRAALDGLRALGLRHWLPLPLGNLGWIAWVQGRLDEAESWQQQALDEARAIGNRWMMAHATEELGLIAVDRGDSAAARRYFGESLALDAAIGATPRLLYSLVGVAGLLQREGEAVAAASLVGFAQAQAAADGEVHLLCERLLPVLEGVLSAGALRLALKEGTTWTEEQALGCAAQSSSR